MNEINKIEVEPLWNILKLLADGEFHSGERLGSLLGISRAAVWKHIQKLEDLGVSLLSLKGRGYCIEGGLDLLDKDTILSNLQTQLPLSLQVFPQLDSTNSFLMRQSDPAMQVCFAEFQSSGRGRRGRAWVSPLAQNIYCSVGWGVEGGVAVLEGLSLAIGVAITRTLKKSSLNKATLKWPNDILYQGKKLAGVLIEITGDPAGYCQVVVGVGLNVAMQGDQVGKIDQPWVALNSILSEQSLPIVGRNCIAASLVDELVNVLQDYHQTGFAKYQLEWMEQAAHLGCQVELRNGLQITKGIFSGVTKTGALCLETGEGKRIFHGGEVSLRSMS